MTIPNERLKEIFQTPDAEMSFALAKDYRAVFSEPEEVDNFLSWLERNDPIFHSVTSAVRKSIKNCDVYKVVAILLAKQAYLDRTTEPRTTKLRIPR